MVNLNGKNKKNKINMWIILFWLSIWQLVSLLIGNKIFLVGPIDVVVRLFELIFERDFWASILFSFSNILLGFFIALIFSIIFSYISYRSDFFEKLFKPLVIGIKSIPVASFIILLLIWTRSENLSRIIPQLIVFPIFYENLLMGLNSVDKDILEMAYVFNFSNYKKIKYIYIPYVIPYFLSSLKVCIGLSFKSGVAAELIGMPKNSIGENLQRAKVYLMTEDLFSWTLIIIFLSFISEKILIKFFNYIYAKVYR